VYNIGMNVKQVRPINTLEIIDSLANENNGIIRTRDAARAGLSRTTLGSLVKKGALERIAHGQYILPNDLPDELYLLQQRSAKIIFSHETALFLHDMAERTPLSHSLTIPSNSKLSPRLSDGCKIYYVQPKLHSLGHCSIMTKMGHEVFAYDVERTVIDILRSRNRIDNQTLAAAMKSYSTRKDQDWSKLREYSEAFHVTKLLRQYLELLT
jgi:predicted transcriptional regulator of viral defense system